jgi:23S rRNA (uracil1939-C5)-methyltransferase
MKKNRAIEYIDLTIDAIGFEGKAVARHESMVYFVEGGIPGDTVRAEIRRRKKKYVEARVTEILQPSPVRVQPVCSYFGDCGGCKWQHLAYSEQVHWKKQHVQDAFQRLGKVEYVLLEDTLACEHEYGYRNKMEFSFSNSRWLTDLEISSGVEFDRDFALGLHVPGRFDKVVDVQECFLQQEIANHIVNAVRQAARERNLAPFETRMHTGFLRNLVIRTSRATGEIMVILVTSPAVLDEENDLIQWLGTTFPAQFREVTTVVHAVTTSKATVAGGVPHVLTGTGTITEELLGVRFRISPFSFFQTNTAQAERLFSTALDYAEIQPDHIVWDLYCGAGSITLCAAARARRVIGIEIVESSIADARNNAENNNIRNADFYLEDMQKAAARDLLSELPAPDVIIVDPPRAGLHADVVQKLLDIGAPTLIYVSCNPATQARDCALLAEKYTIEKLKPVDMFPQTYHIESVARLRRK